MSAAHLSTVVNLDEPQDTDSLMAEAKQAMELKDRTLDSSAPHTRVGTGETFCVLPLPVSKSQFQFSLEALASFGSSGVLLAPELASQLFGYGIPSPLGVLQAL